ncbi:MAG: hypothetical protein EOP04_07910 [Proteobacteria bacterium]|nr:MAG: hypothetical protein EOP04_07910 [Pseudomonadota bacterium]
MKIVIMGLLPFIPVALLFGTIGVGDSFFSNTKFIPMFIMILTLSGMLMLTQWNRELRLELKDTGKILTRLEWRRLIKRIVSGAVVFSVAFYYFDSYVSDKIDWDKFGMPITIMSLLAQVWVAASENIKLRRRLEIERL